MSENQADKPPHKSRTAGRPRDEKSHQAIIKATLELVAEKGMFGASIEAIARRAGVGKTTIYRRWASKEDLVLEVLRELHVEIPFVDTGDLRADWSAFLREAIRIRSSNPQLIQLFFRIYSEAQSYPQYAELLYEKFFKERFEHAVDFVNAAKARGEIRAELDPLLVLLMVGGPMVYFMFLTWMAPGQAPLDRLSQEIVDVALEGIGPRPC